MSALRLGVLPDGTRDVRPIDDGAVGRITHTRYAVRGYGSLIVGESDRARANRIQKEYKARQKAES